MANNLNITSLDFDQIKDNLKTYLRAQNEFKDYDFDSSAISVLLDILAYNTYHNNYYINAAINESFLESAQLRNNVVSRAKMLGYTPTSAHGAEATVQLVITPNDSPTEINIDKDTQFETTIDDITYTFVNTTDVVVNSNPTGVFSTNIVITEGIPLTVQYTVDTSTSQTFDLPNDNVDTRSIVVYLNESSSNSQITTYTLADDITSVSSNSKVYFLEEGGGQRFRIYFGDGTVGKALENGNIVNIDYRVCNGGLTNGANTFTAASLVGGYTDVEVNIIDRASGGSEIQTIDQIKFHAPKSFEMQNRVVTVSDYRSFILQNNPDIQSVNIWGGENNNPPTYGKVFISCKPAVGNLISQAKKNTIIDQLEAKNVMSIDPEIVDPTFLYIVPTITVKYDDDLTTLNAGQILTLISNAVVDYESTQLGLFNKSFYYSKFIKTIDNLDASFVAVNVDLLMQKQFVPNRVATATYTFAFNNSLYHPRDNYTQTVTSTNFTNLGKTKSHLYDDGSGVLKIYYTSGVNELLVQSNAGTIDYTTGIVVINSVLITDNESNEIKVRAKPEHDDIDPSFNQILLIGDVRINIINLSSGQTELSAIVSSTTGATDTILEDGITSVIY